MSEPVFGNYWTVVFVLLLAGFYHTMWYHIKIIASSIKEGIPVKWNKIYKPIRIGVIFGVIGWFMTQIGFLPSPDLITPYTLVSWLVLATGIVALVDRFFPILGGPAWTSIDIDEE